MVWIEPQRDTQEGADTVCFRTIPARVGMDPCVESAQAEPVQSGLLRKLCPPNI